ncbi:YcjF family protein [Arenibacter amylolyticus]|uniref:YcjF family protein n=1 Tax=Arenibacter amylolyticus TaxID=1406873 RepID=UPI001C3D651D|nr:GTPase [Arenibacter amylolyticus]
MAENIGKIIEDAINKALKDRGEINILIAGKTGVGKSTLINAVFQGNFATTGQGKPVTKKTREIKKEGIPLKLFDTRGLELKEYKETFRELESFVKMKNEDSNPSNHIHMAWICVEESPKRIEDAEIELCSLLSNHMPVIGVITKAISDEGFRDKVQSHLIQAKNIVRVNSIPKKLDNGYIIQPSGLEELVELAMEIVPEGQKNAFAAAQRVSIKQKQNKSHAIVAASAVTAGGTAAVPIPFSDAVALVPIQVAMLAGITTVYGFELKKAFLSTLVSSTITGAGATLIGKTIVSNLLKMFPGIGSVAGGLIAASTASALTIAFGEAYIATLTYLIKNKDISEISEADILAEFKKRHSK